MKTEKDFLDMMIGHHEAALEMAKEALELDLTPEVKALAERIIKTQTAEIDEMKEMGGTSEGRHMSSVQALLNVRRRRY